MGVYKADTPRTCFWDYPYSQNSATLQSICESFTGKNDKFVVCLNEPLLDWQNPECKRRHLHFLVDVTTDSDLVSLIQLIKLFHLRGLFLLAWTTSISDEWRSNCVRGFACWCRGSWWNGNGALRWGMIVVWEARKYRSTHHHHHHLIQHHFEPIGRVSLRYESVKPRYVMELYLNSIRIGQISVFSTTQSKFNRPRECWKK